MELELHRTQMAGYDMLIDTTVSHEETLEMIVPDAYPDVQRIVDTDAFICIKGREAGEGRAEITGVICAVAVFCPDGAQGMRRLELSIPFTVPVDVPGLHPGCPLAVLPRVRSIDTRLLNPRKVLVRADITLDVRAWGAVHERVCSEMSADEAVGLQQMRETHTAYLVTAVQEKPFTFSDDVILSGSRPAAEELLSHRVEIRCSESKIIGNKLIFKGEAVLIALYRAVDGMLCSGRWELPFSQIMEATGVEEEAECDLHITMTQSEVAVAHSGGEGRSLSVTLGLLAQAVVREERNMTVVSDAYATAAKLTVEVKSYTLRQKVENGAARQTVRDIIDPGTAVKAVEDVYLRIGRTERTREADETVLNAEVMVTVLYTGEDDELYAVTQQMPVAARVSLPERADCAFRCHCPEDAVAVATAGGMEVRFAVEFRYFTTESSRVTAVAGARAEELPARDASKQPSILLRMMERGERLWDVAKAYNTTIDDILTANERTEIEPGPDALLLIPQRR